ncbi:MAG: metal-dependent transcriptional regulator [bacterium]
MKMHQSTEDYLEAILDITNTKGFCRCVDVADYLHFKKSSVTLALNRLHEEGLILKNRGDVKLTNEGQKIAEVILERHHFFYEWLSSMGIEEERAQEDACNIEHALSQESFQKIKAFVNAHK